ncbi:MAG: molybdopterin-synthase adenylyltransferase MoeB [Acidimicrobiia bacterium]|nr:molybdopterin-synthase adenylyltransferase MoeB [Acidimicrobiia bacterium]
MPTYEEMLTSARNRVAEVTPADVVQRLDHGVVLLDVREPAEWELGALPGAVKVPRGILEYTIGKHVADPSTPIVVYCEGGHRSLLAGAALLDLGYEQVTSLVGGFTRWKQEGHPYRVAEGLSNEQRMRYNRHLILEGVGEAGQQSLLDAKVLLIGAGGLGSPAALYLAAAGVGTLGIIDPDTVDASNLQRQILHDADGVGRPKVESARAHLTALNPDVKVEPYLDRLTADNAVAVMSGYDVVIDGADNFPTRYLVNDASLHLRVPVVHGSIFRFEGQATVFTPYVGPCYRCLFPEPPPPELAPSCAEAGVLGVLPGIIGSIQAMEALKLVLGIGESLAGKLLTYDALDQSFRTLRFDRDPSCPACADESRPPKLVDYGPSCASAGTVTRD